MPLAAPVPAPPVMEIALAPWLVALCVFGAGLAFQAWRAGWATARRALLWACLPATLWLLLAALNPARPTHLVLTPLGAGLAASFACGLSLASRCARRAGRATERGVDCYLWSCAAALPCARLFDWLGKLGSDATVLSLEDRGLSASGALLGAMFGAWWCFRRQPLQGRAWLDAVAPALGLGLTLSWSGAYLQDPTRLPALPLAAAGLTLAALVVFLASLQRWHGQRFVLAALGYGIVQLSAARMDAARSATGWSGSVASWLIIALAIVAGCVWRKGFTSRGI